MYTYTDIALFIDNNSDENTLKNTLKSAKICNIKFTKEPILGNYNLDLNNPVLYNNCANPITLSYINQNVKTDYTMTDIQNPITYNGKLLKRCGVLISAINTSISFDIEIENNKNQKFKTNVYFNIPYENEEKSIYEGNLTIKQDTKFDFYRYE